jgi:23S rRNA-/tRNA-specific pseudouridylate synthase
MWIWIFFALFLLPKRSSFLRVPAWRYSRTLQSSASAISSDTAIVIVERNDHQQRLDRFLASLNDKNIKYSRSFIASLCEQGKVWVNGRCRSKSYRVEEGDNITFAVDRYEQNLKLEPEEIPLDILYEDPYVIAINKLSGMVVHPAPGTPNGTFVNALLFHLGNQSKDLLSNSDAFDPLRDQDIECDTTNQSEPTWEDIWRDCSDPGDDDDDDDDNNKDNFHDGQQDNIYEDDTKSIEELTYSDDLIEWKADQECNNLLVREKLTLELPDMPITKKSALTYLRPGIVHRLDKGTTGVLIAGKSAIAVEKMGKLFAERKLRKIYLAICIGYPGDTSIYKNIGRSPKNRQLMTVTDENHGKHAITHIRTLAFDGKLSVCLVRIETGR